LAVEIIAKAQRSVLERASAVWVWPDHAAALPRRIRSELARIEGIAPLEPTDLTSMIALQALACLEGAMSAQH